MLVSSVDCQRKEKSLLSFVQSEKEKWLKTKNFLTFRGWVECREGCSTLGVPLPSRPSSSVCFRGPSHQRVCLAECDIFFESSRFQNFSLFYGISIGFKKSLPLPSEGLPGCFQITSCFTMYRPIPIQKQTISMFNIVKSVSVTRGER